MATETLTRTGRSTSYKKVTGPGGGTETKSVYRTANHASVISKSGTKNPGWKQAIRLVRQAATPYAVDATNNGFLSGKIAGSFHLTGTPIGQRIQNVLSGELFLDNGPGVPNIPDMSYLDAEAKVNFIRACRSSQRAFQGGVFLGELREAIHMIVRPATALRKAVGNYSRAAKKAVRIARGAKNRAKALSGTWLEYSYGWRPLLSDVDAGMAALADVHHIVPDVIVGYSKDEWTSSRNTYQTSASGIFISGIASIATRSRGRIRYLGCVAWESMNLARDWQSHWGLTLDNFAPTVWELIPYSFLVDYFSNVGAVIDASSFGAVQLRWGVKSEATEAHLYLCDFAPVWTSSSAEDTEESMSLGLSTFSRFHFNRGLVNSVSVGLNDLHFQVPGVGDWRRWSNIAALAVEKIL